MTGSFTDQVAMLFSTPITLSLVLVEIFISVRYDKQYYTAKDTKANLFLGLSYVLVDTVSRAAGIMLLTFFYFYGFHLTSFSNHIVLYWISLVMLEDFTYWFM